MSKFVLDEFNNVNGTITFYKIIEDGVCYWNEFCKTIEKEGIWYEQIYTLISQMDRKAKLKSLPKEKYHDYSTGVKGVNGFEFKTKDLRAYGIKDELGNVIIFAGKKKFTK
ncbi:hypothetical protein [Mucilaginibacter sp.]|uniref:hypothetical protein n=1 Tax=Mucilaginibacter sp. TaxID=1882438 RepID=UPI00284FF2A4|nr:hypothetical protein [Mucilaginibacter sp.]MDR3693517.1 hypothetical protein [Mucilaginibacter sp.]